MFYKSVWVLELNIALIHKCLKTRLSKWPLILSKEAVKYGASKQFNSSMLDEYFDILVNVLINFHA